MNTLALPRVRTRDEYVRERAVSHDDYYAQFVTGETLRHVDWAFDIESLRKALTEDKHLNSIPLHRWHLIATRELDGRRFPRLNPSGPFAAAIPFDRAAASAAGEVVTRSTLVCIAKCAARMLVEHSDRSETTPGER